MLEDNNKIDTLIKDSGMLTHIEVTKILRENGWSVTVSPYYYDSITDTIREADLLVEKQLNSSRNFDSSVQVNIQLFIECKYIKQEIVFWFDSIDTKKAILNLEQETGLFIVGPERMGGDIGSEGFHHLNQSKVAKLFSTNSNREDVMYKAMNQSLHSQMNYRKMGEKHISIPFSKNKDVFTKVIQYPVIICDNFKNLLRLKFENSKNFSTETIKDHFILETNYRETYFLIDVVDINYLETFLVNLEKEAQSLIKAYVFKQDFKQRK